LQVSGQLGFCSRVVADGLGRNWAFWSGVGLGLRWLDSVRVAGVRPSGRTSSSSPGCTRFSGDLSLTSVTSFRRPFSLFFSPFLSLLLPLIPFSVFRLVRKGLTLQDLRGFENPTFCLLFPTVYNVGLV